MNSVNNESTLHVHCPSKYLHYDKGTYKIIEEANFSDQDEDASEASATSDDRKNDKSFASSTNNPLDVRSFSPEKSNFREKPCSPSQELYSPRFTSDSEEEKEEKNNEEEQTTEDQLKAEAYRFCGSGKKRYGRLKVAGYDLVTCAEMAKRVIASWPQEMQDRAKEAGRMMKRRNRARATNRARASGGQLGSSNEYGKKMRQLGPEDKTSELSETSKGESLPLVQPSHMSSNPIQSTSHAQTSLISYPMQSPSVVQPSRIMSHPVQSTPQVQPSLVSYPTQSFSVVQPSQMQSHPTQLTSYVQPSLLSFSAQSPALLQASQKLHTNPAQMTSPFQPSAYPIQSTSLVQSSFVSSYSEQSTSQIQPSIASSCPPKKITSQVKPPPRFSSNQQPGVHCGIFHKNHPSQRLSKEDMDKVQLFVQQNIIHHKYAMVCPRFHGHKFKDGWLLLRCVDIDTFEWVKSLFESKQPWEGANLKVLDSNNFPKAVIVTGYFPKNTVESQDILEILAAQNRIPSIIEWTELNRHIKGDSEFPLAITFRASEESVAALPPNRQLFFGMDKITIKEPNISKSSKIPKKQVRQVAPFPKSEPMNQGQLRSLPNRFSQVESESTSIENKRRAWLDVQTITTSASRRTETSHENEYLVLKRRSRWDTVTAASTRNIESSCADLQGNVFSPINLKGNLAYDRPSPSSVRRQGGSEHVDLMENRSFNSIQKEYPTSDTSSTSARRRSIQEDSFSSGSQWRSLTSNKPPWIDAETVSSASKQRESNSDIHRESWKTSSRVRRRSSSSDRSRPKGQTDDRTVSSQLTIQETPLSTRGHWGYWNSDRVGGHPHNNS